MNDFSPATPHRADGFQMMLPEGWKDKTIHVLKGPVEEGFQHLMTVQVDDEGGGVSLENYVDWQVHAREQALQGLRLLLRKEVRLDNGIPACRLVFSWQPAEPVCIYQEHIFLVHQDVGYQLSASFTKKTRLTLGPAVLRCMLAFEPLS